MKRLKRRRPRLRQTFPRRSFQLSRPSRRWATRLVSLFCPHVLPVAPATATTVDKKNLRPRRPPASPPPPAHPPHPRPDHPPKGGEGRQKFHRGRIGRPLPHPPRKQPNPAAAPQPRF